jgi:hypothetical protein
MFSLLAVVIHPKANASIDFPFSIFKFFPDESTSNGQILTHPQAELKHNFIFYRDKCYTLNCVKDRLLFHFADFDVGFIGGLFGPNF